ncbi:unnamed protein product [Phytophthora lilii]|uniref:Unnamed protein product n=1 Tax=Phytophthora lilii TaxID=2077276 RepID=A0A9W6TTC3_9STRA|nr:unnamed protein product [Phytophthora lilii]
MPTPRERSPALDPLHSPGSDKQQPPPRSTLAQLTLSAEDASPTFRQNRATREAAEPMTKTKRRMFSTPLLRRSATASTAAAASAASRIKSNLSTVTKLPNALKRTTTNSGLAASSAPEPANDHKAAVDRAPTIPSLSRSSTDSSVKHEETKVAPHHNKMFAIPSLMRIRTGEKTHSKPLSTPVQTVSDCPLDSPEARSEHSRSNSSNNSSNNNNNSSDAEVDTNDVPTPSSQKSAMNSASRFVMGVPTMLRRAVSSNHTPPRANAAPTTAPQKKSPDTSANSTPRGEFPEDDLEENDRHSLLLMLQVPESQRHSQVPLMAASETW